jgi:DNA-binding response OmpR family regulator
MNGTDTHKTCDRSVGASLPLAKGSTVLLVEDEASVAMMMSEALIALEFRVLGPYGTVADAMRAAVEMPLDAAILDIRLGEELVYPLAEVLETRGVPFVFVSGYGVESLDPRYKGASLLQKPVDIKALRDLFAAVGGPTELMDTQESDSRATIGIQQSAVSRL